ncbi:MAG: DUF1961 family protein [Planctomycetes bacterium]|nr:DUF1961 family protein [Planctomycetota bacterium]
MNQPSQSNQQAEMIAHFDRLNDQSWSIALDDNGTGNWQDNWALDGKVAEVSNSAKGMEFKSGPDAGNHAHHAVLWTKESFVGDMKVSFDFTRLDTVNRGVCILYFHANGIEEDEYVKDIHSWSHLRDVPYMQTYFEKMDMLHVSYAAFGNSDDTADDYIRVRRYPVCEDRDFDEMEVDGTIFETGLFVPEKTYTTTFIKTRDELVMEIIGDGKSLYHHWDISTVEPTESGPFGFRQMWQKHAVYKNIKISIK